MLIAITSKGGGVLLFSHQIFLKMTNFDKSGRKCHSSWSTRVNHCYDNANSKDAEDEVKFQRSSYGWICRSSCGQGLNYCTTCWVQSTLLSSLSFILNCRLSPSHHPLMETSCQMVLLTVFSHPDLSSFISKQAFFPYFPSKKKILFYFYCSHFVVSFLTVCLLYFILSVLSQKH